MFGKKQQVHIHKHEAQHVTNRANTEIIEKRAPTDESVKLLMEMERAAEGKMLQAWHINLEDNRLDGLVVQIDKSPMHNKNHYVVTFKLNGQLIKADVMIDEDGENDPAKVFLDVMTKELSVRIFEQYRRINITRYGGRTCH